MKNYLLVPVTALSLSGCIHDDVARQSPPEPTRSFEPINARQEITRTEGPTGRYASDRVYLITRLETADQPRGEWRTLGNSIYEDGSRIRFVEMGTGRLVEFTAPHQVTPMSSRQDQRVGPDTSNRIVGPPDRTDPRTGGPAGFAPP